MAKYKFVRLPVPELYYVQALQFVNDKRKDIGLPALKELPAGRPMSHLECPCANACRTKDRILSVGLDAFAWLKEKNAIGDYVQDPNFPHKFVRYFDTYAPLVKVNRETRVKPVPAMGLLGLTNEPWRQG